jgi:hypothetical protein
MTVRQDLTDANSLIGRSLINGAASLAGTAFLNLGDWRDADADRYLDLIRDPLTSLKNEGAKSTQAFYRTMAQLDGQRYTPIAIAKSELATSVLRNGVSEATVWKRPFVTMRTALAEGKSVSESIELGAARAQYLAETEVQLARRNVGLKARGSNDRIVGFIRTLTGSENCALCYVASTQRYTRGELLPIHPGCDCGEMPIYGTQDPGQIIDEMRLSATHQKVAERFGISDPGAREPDYRKIAIKDHGEIGPTLTVRGQDFTGPTNLDLVGTKAKPPANATVPDFFGLGLKTQLLGKVETNPSEIKKKTNPRYSEGVGYQINCTNAVTAYDLRRRGYDVQAKPRQKGRAMIDTISDSYLKPDGTEFAGSDDFNQFFNSVPRNNILRHIVDNNPVGSRGFINGVWTKGRTGHVWAWEIQDDGKIKFIEPQNPDPASTSTYLKRMTRTGYIRTDNLKPKPSIIDSVEDAT